MKEIRVDSKDGCPFRADIIGAHVCSAKYPRKRCEGEGIPSNCPLRRDSIIVNIGSLGMADVGGKVG